MFCFFSILDKVYWIVYFDVNKNDLPEMEMRNLSGIYSLEIITLCFVLSPNKLSLNFESSLQSETLSEL